MAWDQSSHVKLYRVDSGQGSIMMLESYSGLRDEGEPRWRGVHASTRSRGSGLATGHVQILNAHVPRYTGTYAYVQAARARTRSVATFAHGYSLSALERGSIHGASCSLAAPFQRPWTWSRRNCTSARGIQISWTTDRSARSYARVGLQMRSYELRAGRPTNSSRSILKLRIHL